MKHRRPIHKNMDYYSDRDDEEISNIKILKYMLICTLVLLKIGLVTLFIRYSVLVFIDPAEPFPCHLMLAYAGVFVITLVALVATFRDNFFFLVVSASLNFLLSGTSIFLPTYRWSIIMLQIISSLFIFAYTLSMYFKMKFDILQKKRLKRLEELQSNFKRYAREEHIYQVAPSLSTPSKSFNRVELTNEWILNQGAPDSLNTI